MTSSKMKSAPYLSHTDFMALKYPFGAGTTPVVAPTTVSATTLWYCQLGYSRPGHASALTAYDSIWTKFKKFIFELLAQSLDILFLGLVRLLEALSVSRGDVVIVLVVKDGFIRSSTCRMVGKGKRSNGIAVKRELPCDEVGPLRLLRLIEILRDKLLNER